MDFFSELSYSPHTWHPRHPAALGKRGSYWTILAPRGQEIHLNHQGQHGDPPAPSAQPTDEAKQMLDPTLNLG